VKGMVDAEAIRRALLVKAAMDLVKEKAVVKAPKAKPAAKSASSTASKAKTPAKTEKKADAGVKSAEEKPATAK
ncbi:MAG: hypothetical protein J6X72_05600, partial [Clostridia bacterium]|nr:hypothetical protein [Clostridia bacterium]